MKQFNNPPLAQRSGHPHHKQLQTASKTYSPTRGQASQKMENYENLALQAKQQLTTLQRGQNKPVLQQQKAVQQASNQKLKVRESKELGQSGNHKQLQHHYSQKYLKGQQLINQSNKDKEMYKNGDEAREQGRKKVSAEGKVQSPKKNHYIDIGEYRKLHEKLDNIQSKISDLKKNLQKKKTKEQKPTASQPQKPKSLALKALVTQMPQHAQLHTFTNNPYSPRHNIYYVSELVRAYKDERSLAREHLNTTLNILKIIDPTKKSTDDHIRKMAVKLPRSEIYEGKKTLVFDLDETLIHCNDSTNVACDVKLPIKFATGETIEAGINIRPYAKEILKTLSQHFEIILFTASHSCYANVVIDHLDPQKEWVQHRLFRQHCLVSSQGMYIKDLRIINRDLKDMVLIDNAAYSYAFQLANGIPILPYYHGQIDFELKKLEDYLVGLIGSKDVREENEKVFKLTQYRHFFGQPEALVQQLYLQK